MLFNSWQFIILLVCTWVLFYAVPKNGRTFGVQSIILLLASTIFYGWEDYRLLGLLFLSCIGNTFASLNILLSNSSGHELRAKRWVKLAVIMNLLLLGIFKYAGFIAGMIPLLSPDFVQSIKSIPLPIGISFYTFHGISMIVDMSHRKVHTYDQSIAKDKRKSLYVQVFRDMGLYLIFFPQLIAGPIIKAHYFWPQLKAKYFKNISWGRVFRYLLTGYFLKMVVADNLSPVTDVLKHADFISSSNGVTLITLLIGYSFQIFADFGGYSMIAIGLATLFGYRFPINFNFPYLSRSLTQFWQRWNMTLSAWLRDYLYIPLGGNRKGSVRTYINLFLVMFLGGLWHGADWRFALWGTLHGLFLAIERWCSRRRALAKIHIPPVFSVIYCFCVVSLLWATFLMPDIHLIKLFLERICSQFSCPIKLYLFDPNMYCIILFSAFVVFYHVLGIFKERGSQIWKNFIGSKREAVLYAFMFFMILVNSGPQCGFVYFQF